MGKIEATLPTGVEVREGKVGPGRLGEWNRGTGVITINPNQSDVGKIVVLIHEAMHMASSHLRQMGLIQDEIGEQYIEGAAFGIAMTLAHCGLLNGCTGDEIDQFHADQCASAKG